MMAVMLVAMAFILILIGIWVNVTHNDSGVRFAVRWTAIVGAFCFLMIAGKVYVS